MWDLLSILRGTSGGTAAYVGYREVLVRQRNHTLCGVTAQAAHGGRDHVTGFHLPLSLDARQRVLRRDGTERGHIR